MDRPLYDIIIGNVEGAKDPEDVTVNCDNETAKQEDAPEQNQAVETRQQKQHKPIKPLVVPVSYTHLTLPTKRIV